MNLKPIYLFLAGLLISPSAFAAPIYDAHTEVELIASVDAARPGEEFLAAVRFKTDPEWHVYWKNPGDSGMAPDIQWELPPGVEAGELRWPYPEVIEQPPLASYGYERETLLAAPIKTPPTSTDITLKARVRWLACKVECIPGKAELSLTIPTGAVSTPSGQWSTAFQETESRWPVVSSRWKTDAFISGNTLSIRLQGDHDPGKTHFFAEDPALVRHADPQTLKKIDGAFELQVPLSVNRKQISRLAGVLVSENGWEGEGSAKAMSADILIQKMPSSPASEPAEKLGFGLALVFAFLGGIILNLMPCVLPVLSLKVLHFVREASENPRALSAQGGAFTAGVLVSFWMLAGLLALIKAAGTRIGWGFQLQSPEFVIVLSFLFVLFALNLFGVFEFGSSLGGAGQGLARRHGLQGAFFSGVFATVVATPCTAPFMGAALGYTLAQPIWISLAVFTAVGLGMSAPYLLLCIQPAFLRFVPKPGNWMITLKQILGLPLLATVAWLAWVLGVQRGLEAVIGLFAGCFFAGVAAWIWGRGFAKTAAVLVLVAGLALSFWSASISKPSAAESASAEGIAWEKYSEERLDALRAEGRAVFIDFTAAWCLTCQVNERVALSKAEVVKAFREKGIVPLKADWTSQDPEIEAALARYGRNSIPLYVYYPAGSSEHRILPEILTPRIVLEALDAK